MTQTYFDPVILIFLFLPALVIYICKIIWSLPVILVLKLLLKYKLSFRKVLLIQLIPTVLIEGIILLVGVDPNNHTKMLILNVLINLIPAIFLGLAVKYYLKLPGRLAAIVWFLLMIPNLSFIRAWFSQP